MCVNFMLLARGTAFDIVTDEGSQTRPPKLTGDQLPGFKYTRVPRGRMIVVASDDGVPKGCVIGDIDSSLVSEDTRIIVPVGEVGTETGGDFARKSVECVKHERVRCGGSTKFLGKRGVKKVNK